MKSVILAAENSQLLEDITLTGQTDNATTIIRAGKRFLEETSIPCDKLTVLTTKDTKPYFLAIPKRLESQFWAAAIKHGLHLHTSETEAYLSMTDGRSSKHLVGTRIDFETKSEADRLSSFLKSFFPNERMTETFLAVYGYRPVYGVK